MLDATSHERVSSTQHTLPNIAEGILVLDENKFITYANEAAETMLGYGTSYTGGSHLIGVPYQRLSAAPLAPLNGAPAKIVEGALRHKNGRWLTVNLTQSHIAPNLPHILVSFTNSAEQLQQEQSLTHTQRLAGLGTLTASIAHELTNPISIITTTCHAILQDMQDKSLNNDQLAQYTQMIERSAWRCIRLTDTLRGYTRQGKLQLAITDFAALVEDALLLVQQQFLKEFNVSIHTDLDAEHQTIVCDPNRLTQVLVNLLTNARDAMQPAGGEITIRSWFIAPGERDVQLPTVRLPEAITAVGAFAFAIEDSGPGIAPDVIEHIFSPFFTTKRSGAGTGLGLYIAREIVEQHNGRLLAENTLHAGARFIVLLPQH